VETEEGIRNVDAIAQVDGIDVVWIGQYDLTASIGCPGDFEDARYKQSVLDLLEACGKNNKSAGYTATSPADARSAVRAGFRCLSYAHDVMLYKQALREGLAHFQVDRGATA
jgi:2-dehydro-3-deoxyglucarate aldolase/4-hydroxy-2-oxoheptanedioate aldolase